MRLPVLGVDPGRSAGAYLLDGDGRGCLGWWAWTRLVRKDGTFIRLRTHRGEFLGHDLNWVGRWLAGRAFVSCVEELFVPRARKRKDGKKKPVNPQSVIPLAEACGKVMGPIEDGSVTVLRVMAKIWRPEIASIPAAWDADRAEAEAIRLVVGGQVVDAPSGLSRLTKKERGAVCEAACIARWGWVHSNPGGNR